MSKVVVEGAQVDLFELSEYDKYEMALAYHRKMWKVCWDWDGPEVGGYCQLDSVCAKLETPYQHPDYESEFIVTTIYAYMERCRLIEKRPNGEWLAVIEMGIVHGQPWSKDGTRIILTERDMWPSVRDMRRDETDCD